MTAKHIKYLFCTSTILTMVAEFFSVFVMELIFKPLIILSLYLLYRKVRTEKLRIYDIGLALSLLSNIFFLDRDNRFLLLLRVIATVIYMVIYIVIMIKNTATKNFLTVLFVSIPFLAISAYEISLFAENLTYTFWPIVIGAIIICVYCGLAFYTYFLKNTRKTSYLLVSGICIFSMAILFSLEAFFINFKGLRVPVIGSYAIFQYSYMKFVVEKDYDRDLLID